MKKNLVVLTGAGISAESGIATFRDSNGLWENHRVEDVASPEAWSRDPDLVTQFYNMRRQSVKDAHPNAAHKALADLEKDFNVTIITQNIDDLHERAGSNNIIHLHGEIFKVRCEEDEHDIVEWKEDITSQNLSKKGKRLRPHIVWFGEMVPKMEEAILSTATADIFVVIGTSLNVYPAAGLLNYAPQGIPIFIIDKNLPNYAALPNITAIEKPATEGVLELKEHLSKID